MCRLRNMKAVIWLTAVLLGGLLASSSAQTTLQRTIDGARRLLLQTEPNCNNQNGAVCPTAEEVATWFNTAAVKTVNADGTVTVNLRNGFPGNPVSFITVSTSCCPDPAAACTTSPCQKFTTVSNNGNLGTYTIPANKCATSLCVYAHDGRWGGSPPAPQPNPAGCIDSVNQRCQLCSYTSVQVRGAQVCSDCTLDETYPRQYPLLSAILLLQCMCAPYLCMCGVLVLIKPLHVLCLCCSFLGSHVTTTFSSHRTPWLTVWQDNSGSTHGGQLACNECYGRYHAMLTSV